MDYSYIIHQFGLMPIGLCAISFGFLFLSIGTIKFNDGFSALLCLVSAVFLIASLIIPVIDKETHTGTLEKTTATITQVTSNSGDGLTTLSNGSVIPVTNIGSVNDDVDLVCLSGQPSVCALDGYSMDETRIMLMNSLADSLTGMETLKTSKFELTQK